MIHELKIKESFAGAILRGEKNFEVRRNDRGFQKGDKIVFTVIDDTNIPYVAHPLKDKVFEITYVLSGWGIKEEYVVFGIKDITGADMRGEEDDHTTEEETA